MKTKTFLFGLCLSIGLYSCQSNEATEQTQDTAPTEAKQAATKKAAEKEVFKGIKVGDKAPAFELKNVDGQMYSFANIKAANDEAAKGYIVTFTCNTCPYAVKYEDRIIDLHNKLAPMGYPVVAIQPNDVEVKPGDSFEAMQVRHEEKAFPFLYLLDEGQQVYPKYGASKTPEVYLVDGDGIVRYHGAIDDNAQHPEEVTVNYVEKAVAAIEAGLDPDPADVKAIGCSIKTK